MQRQKGVALILLVVISATMLMVTIIASQIRLFETETHVYRERQRIETEIALRGCMSLAFVRHINGLKRYPKKFYNEGVPCVLQSVATTTSTATLFIVRSSSDVYVRLHAVYDTVNLKLLSYYFD